MTKKQSSARPFLAGIGVTIAAFGLMAAVANSAPKPDRKTLTDMPAQTAVATSVPAVASSQPVSASDPAMAHPIPEARRHVRQVGPRFFPDPSAALNLR